ncbi:hypothetical protein [Kordiimonas laminariae]|uniref:hypothetical protein n=1 Tax=Kordiimonas laminariae TaxID=2917717 RepID=UPI001FF5251A|nr:hypothetical protein [Kordiimonas laminariae]MCK0070462.1 hypothetical protein [Kordiimonas laminariae]
MFNEDQHTKRLFGTDTTMGLFVALYMILLAFFIMLNAVSEQKTSKAQEVMKGVNAAFSKESDDQSRQPGEQTTLPNDEVKPENDPLLIELSRSFGGEFDVNGKFSINKGLVYEVELPADSFFEKGSFRIRPDMEPFLDRIAKLVLDRENNETRNVAFMFGSGEGLVSRDLTRSQEFAVRRAGAIARFMKLQGVPDGMFHTGFIQIPEGKILAAFRNVPPVRFENGGEIP